MKKLILDTLTNKYFPTYQFEHKTDNPAYIELKNHLEGIKELIVGILPADKYNVEVHTAVGKIAACPWIGIHSSKESFESSSQKGIYLTILWNYDGSGICLSLQTGTDSSKTQEIIDTVQRVRIKYGNAPFRTTINLYAPNSAIRPKNYEKANITGKNYDKFNLDTLMNDLQVVEKYYAQIVSNRVQTLEKIQIMDTEEFIYQNPTPKQTSSSSTTWVRNPKIREEALKNASYSCEIDSLHKTFITDKHQFMEGHHLIPMEYQDKYPSQSLDIVENIIALCPNCHRAVHYASMSDKLNLIRKLFKKKKQQLQLKIGIDLQTLESFYDNV